MNKLLLFALALTAVSCAKNHWAVLVAGSNGYWNYRHQSDVFHAYHVLIDHGMDPDHIIVMAYDDIANDSDNPIPGKVFNWPDGTDVYQGVKIDYKGDDVTPENFMKIMTGDEEGMRGIGSGKVLKSDENSNVFTFFSDHGGVGVICFPYDDLYVEDFEDTLNTMYDKNMFKKFVFYLEACESGSMFVDFPDLDKKRIDINYIEGLL